MPTNAARSFTDPAGVSWRVFRVEPEPVSEMLERLRETLKSAPPERRRPWLLFESAAGERRRLAPVPNEWDLGPSTLLLAEWCTKAERVPPAPAQRSADRGPSVL
jgi:hypothetical protein